MDNEILNEDIPQLVKQSVILYKDQPVFVEAINGRILSLKNLITDKISEAVFSFKDFRAPSELGMVNIQKTCVYFWRKPMRQWSMGLTFGNSTWEYVSKKYEPLDLYQFTDLMYKFNNKEIANCIINNYPDIKQAVKTALENKSIVAFHRNFAVDGERNIYYKTHGVVGRVNRIHQVIFDEPCKYLEQLLNFNYEDGIGRNSLCGS